MIDSLNPDVMRKNIRISKAEVNANTEAVAELEELIGATPLETGKTITSELAEHETRVTALESGGGVHIYDATGNNSLHTDANGRVEFNSEHILASKKIPLFHCWNSGTSFAMVLPEDNAGGKRFNILKLSDGSVCANQTYSVKFMYFD